MGAFEVDSSLITFMANLMWIQAGHCVLNVDLFGFSITLNQHIQAGLGLDSGWILGGFGVDLRGFASFFLDSLFVFPPLVSFFDVFLSDPNFDVSAQVLIL